MGAATSDLPAAQGHGGGGAQGDLGLAEADIAADQTVHRPAARQVIQDGGDGGGLVDGLREGEAGDEGGVGLTRRDDGRSLGLSPSRATMATSRAAVWSIWALTSARRFSQTSEPILSRVTAAGSEP